MSSLLAEHEGKVVFRLLLVPQVFEAESLQETQQTLIVYGEIGSWHIHGTHNTDETGRVRLVRVMGDEGVRVTFRAMHCLQLLWFDYCSENYNLLFLGFSK